MKKFFTLIALISLYNCNVFSQAVYTSSNYANIGDTFYLTSPTIDTTNFFATGANYLWDFSKLKGVSQQQLVFRNPKSTGFTQIQWPYIYNTNNTNLSSSTGQVVAIGTITEANPNDYFLKTSSALAEKASSYNIAYSDIAVNVKNVYTTDDTLYRFPLGYTDTFSSNASYATVIPSLYYNAQTTARGTAVDGWGTVKTPYGTFTHCIRLVSWVTQTDTFAIAGEGIPSVTVVYRELKWLDTSKGYPVLYVKQLKSGNNYITDVVQYIDNQQYFQPEALFAYIPLAPIVNDTVNFQNLSTNASAYLWSFGDGSATSTTINPQHAFTAPGKYTVQLVAYNGTLTDTISLSVTVASTLPVQLVSFTGEHTPKANVLNWSTATQINMAYFMIERSSDGITFETLSSVTAAGNSNTLLAYSFADNSFSAGNNYYRLKMSDEDGNYTYSNTILIKDGSANAPVLLWPNPIRRGQSFSISIHSNTAGPAAINIFDASGKVIKNMQVELSTGNNIYNINTDGLTPGNYFILYHTANNIDKQCLKIQVAP